MITKRRIRNLDLYTKSIMPGAAVRCAVLVTELEPAKLTKVGFSPDLLDGETILPSVSGPITRFNAEGKNKVLRDQPKETAYRTIQWTWKEYHGDQQVEQTDFRDIPYSRYPRQFIPPPSVELTLLRDEAGAQIICVPETRNDPDHREEFLHKVNLLLELFGICHLMTDESNTIRDIPTHRINWVVLPEGEMPWERLRDALEPLVERAKEGNRPFLEHRLQSIHRFRPDFQVLGNAGFAGYVIFGFRGRLFVCESALYGNATYVFGTDWERLSRLTKAEIINGSQEQTRIVHTRSWTDRMVEVFVNEGIRE